MSAPARPRPAARARIRAGRPADAAAVHALESFFPGDRMSLRSARHLLRSPAARVLIAEAAGVGGAAGALVLLSRRNSRSARIYSLVVHPRARGCGLAQALVRRAEAEARRRGCQAVSLEVRADNRAARSLYAGLGYCELKRLPEYYEDGADGLRLQRGFTARRG